MKLSLLAPAKINWFLSVLNKRDDGYHNIASAMQTVDLFDQLSFEDADAVELVSDIDVPPKDNLVYKTAILLQERCACRRGARIHLSKNIPIAAGLGGGSSDAAAALVALNRLWRLDLSDDDLRELALHIGSDVPFFISGGFSLVEGRGEEITRMPVKGDAVMLLVNPGIPVSASWAYKNLKTTLTKKHFDIKLFCRTLDEGDLVSLKRMVFNDLEVPVISEYPVVGEIIHRLIDSGAVISSMSGSGPTVFGVFRSTDEAVTASRSMGDMWCRVAKTLTPDRKTMQEL